jgi:hypothetical protein
MASGHHGGLVLEKRISPPVFLCRPSIRIRILASRDRTSPRLSCTFSLFSSMEGEIKDSRAAEEPHVPVVREKERAEDLPEHFVGVVDPYFIERYRQSGEKESGKDIRISTARACIMRLNSNTSHLDTCPMTHMWHLMTQPTDRRHTSKAPRTCFESGGDDTASTASSQPPQLPHHHCPIQSREVVVVNATPRPTTTCNTDSDMHNTPTANTAATTRATNTRTD